MADFIYKVEFFSDWHCGSGLSSGTDTDQLVIKDRVGFPFIPGKTIKGVLKDSAQTLRDCGFIPDKFISEIFGLDANGSEKGDESIASVAGKAFFSNAELTDYLKKSIADDEDYFYRKIASTAIEGNGQAKEHSLRKTEVTIPLALFGKIVGIDSSDVENLAMCMKFTKRMGTGRNRGFGRCDISIFQEVKE